MAWDYTALLAVGGVAQDYMLQRAVAMKVWPIDIPVAPARMVKLCRPQAELDHQMQVEAPIVPIAH